SLNRRLIEECPGYLRLGGVDGRAEGDVLAEAALLALWPGGGQDVALEEIEHGMGLGSRLLGPFALGLRVGLSRHGPVALAAGFRLARGRVWRLGHRAMPCAGRAPRLPGADRAPRDKQPREARNGYQCRAIPARELLEPVAPRRWARLDRLVVQEPLDVA